jgi:hypothetical protein
MLLDDAYLKKQDFKKKILKHFQNIFNKKLKYDKKIKQNKSESKAIKKNINNINKQCKSIFMHYSKIENELIEYIGILNTKIYPNNLKFEPKIIEINKSILEMLEYFQKKRLRILQEHKDELEINLFNYQDIKDKERTKELYNRYKMDVLLFQNSEKTMKEILSLLPSYKKLELECQKLEYINYNLRMEYDEIKVENRSLLDILDNLKNKNKDKKPILKKSKSSIFKNKIKKYKMKYFNKNKNSFNNSKNSFHKNNSQIFLSQKQSASKIFNNKKNIKNRCSSAKVYNNYNINELIEDKSEVNNELNKYIVELLKKLNYNTNIKYKEIEQKYSKEIQFRNNVKDLFELCVDDLDDLYKKEKNDIKRKKLEENIFILSYLYDNCLNNGDIKYLKLENTKFIPKK